MWYGAWSPASSADLCCIINLNFPSFCRSQLGGEACVPAWHLAHQGWDSGTGREHINGLVQERRNSSALAMELRLSCTNPWMSCVFLALMVLRLSCTNPSMSYVFLALTHRCGANMSTSARREGEWLRIGDRNDGGRLGGDGGHGHESWITSKGGCLITPSGVRLTGLGY